MIGGTYSIILKTPLGAKKGTLKLNEKGGTLTGSMSILGFRIRLRAGRCEGNSFKFSSRLRTPVRELAYNCEGTVTGDELTGVMTTSRSSMAISGTRLP